MRPPPHNSRKAVKVIKKSNPPCITHSSSSSSASFSLTRSSTSQRNGSHTSSASIASDLTAHSILPCVYPDSTTSETRGLRRVDDYRWPSSSSHSLSPCRTNHLQNKRYSLPGKDSRGLYCYYDSGGQYKRPLSVGAEGIPKLWGYSCVKEWREEESFDERHLLQESMSLEGEGQILFT